MLVPVVIFAFNRPKHIGDLMTSLSLNPEASETEIFVYIDGPRNGTDKIKTIEVSKNISKFQEKFAKINIIKRTTNYGSALNIVTGISEQFNTYNALIILEDDLIVSKKFLSYMNSSLTTYENERQVFHISAYSDFLSTSSLVTCHFSSGMNCWGWGTWKDRWLHFDNQNIEFIMRSILPEKYKFNFDNSHDFFLQLDENKHGIMKTWAIFWYAAIFLQSGLSLNPSLPLAINRGNDGTGERHGNSTFNDDSRCLVEQQDIKFPNLVQFDLSFYNKQVDFYRSRKSFINEIIKTVIYKIIPIKHRKKVIQKLLSIRQRFC